MPPPTDNAHVPNLDSAYRHCGALARQHYENFPVASLALPKRLREPVAVVYAFARTADDLADEGDLDPPTRLAMLDRYGARLEAAAAGDPPDDPIFVALSDLLRRHDVPVALFRDLLSAFRQDVTCRRYADFAAVLDYCRRSADPVGRILLHLHGSAEAQHLVWSDRICSALQLINFWQDLGQDVDENGRIYLPQDEMAAFGVTEAQLAARRNDAALRALIGHQVARTRTMLLEGAPLGGRLRGRFGLEIRLIVEGGLAVLRQLEARDDPFARPRLRRRDRLLMLFRAALHRPSATRRAGAAG